MSDLLQVPVALLRSPGLSASAKLAWMLAQLRAITTAAANPAARPSVGASARATNQRAPLSRPTMRRGLAQLADAGWDPRQPEAASALPTVAVPAQLLTDPRLSIGARVLYPLLVLMPSFEHPSGQFTYAELTKQTEANLHTVKKAVRQLVFAEWLTIDQAHRLAPVHFELTFPGFDRQMSLIAAVENRMQHARYPGEQLMKEYLSLLVGSEEFTDNARPGFLVNPRTGERLEFDRFYPPRVAWEFNGAQHDRATGKFTIDEVAVQKERDLIKTGICALKGIALVVVKAQDLTQERMRKKVGNLLPLRDLAGYDLLAGFLDAKSASERRRWARF